MSHTIAPYNGDTLRFVIVTIVNYVVGGEPVSASDAGVNGVDAVIFGTIPPSANSLGVPLFPILYGSNIKLFKFVSGAPVEIATTSNLNAIIPCLVHVSLL